MTSNSIVSMIKKLPDVVRQELDTMTVVDLQKTVADSEEAINTATKERDANPKYKEAKDAVTALSSALKDTKAYQGAKIQYALLRLRQSKGDDVSEFEEALTRIREYKNAHNS